MAEDVRQSILVDKGAKLPTVNFQLKHTHLVREDYYDCFFSSVAQG